MKPTAKSRPELAPLLAFGAHPDDIEFGCGGVAARESRLGRAVHMVVCSRGESASRGTPAVRASEARRAARLLGATLEFVELDGDARLEVRAAHALTLAAIIRRVRPGIVLAPTLVGNQHPDHPRLGRIVRDAARLARYGGLGGLRGRPAHAIGQLLYYAVSQEAEPAGALSVLIDISEPEVVAAWTAAMGAHRSQLSTRNYVELQLSRARVHGLRAGAAYAQALYPNDPLVFGELEPLLRGARRF
ncbi:MAG: PIG-L family deacetylase [Opitutaceae bacterium]|jgi:LmbE family N-acetylglucosaminyl deacetylase